MHSNGSCAKGSTAAAKTPRTAFAGFCRTWGGANPARRGRVLVCRAALELAPLLLGACSAGGIALSLSRKRQRSSSGEAAAEGRKARLQREAEEEGGFFWTLAAVLSAIPLANWTAWLLLAQADADDGRSPALCYCFAALYAMPALQGGLVPDATDLLLLGLGALHIQVERLARTEPDSLPRIRLPDALTASAEATAERLLSQGSALKEAAEDAKSLPGVDPVARIDLKDFDKKLQKKREEESVEDSWGP